MSTYFSKKLSALKPYVPGEQPGNMASLVKLNTNESPFPPSEKAKAFALINTRELNLYSDPSTKSLAKALAARYGVDEDMVVLGNGSDEILLYAFTSYTDRDIPALFADITYGFYPVFASICLSPYEEIPLRDDYSLSVDDYMGKKGTVFLANPNAPTGMALPVSEIERLVKSDTNRIVVVDEAYVDFGAESAVPLVKKYPNIIVSQTFSKSRSFAGGRLGYAIAPPALIRDLNTVKYSMNPYNVNSATLAMGEGILMDREYTDRNLETIMANRELTVSSLERMGFTVLPSRANFIFASHPRLDGGKWYTKLREKGILVRHFDKPRLKAWCRITIASLDSMEKFLAATEEILEEEI